MTKGDRPPRYSPAATAHASPSRQTRISRMPPLSIPDSQRPSVESGTVTTWVMPSRWRSEAIWDPGNTPGLALGPGPPGDLPAGGSFLERDGEDGAGFLLRLALALIGVVGGNDDVGAVPGHVDM